MAMRTTTGREIRLIGEPPVRRQLVSSSVLGMLLFLFVEGMLFAGLMSAFVIVKAAAPGGWPPPGQPRLPIESTALNSLALLGSGVALYIANVAFRRRRSSARAPLLWAMSLGGFFVLFQGYEWTMLIGEGLTVTSSVHGSFFYLIVGTHALHALGALGFLVFASVRLARNELSHEVFAATQAFWYFVVGVWPILYFLVYL